MALRLYPWLPRHLARLHDFLQTHEPTWGFTIYRTTYSAQSEAEFPQIISLVTSYIKQKFYNEYYSSLCQEDSNNSNNNNNKKAVFDEIWARYTPRIIEDAQEFDGASIDAVRSHFEAWVEKERNTMRDRFPSYRMFVVIDEESFRSLVDAPPAEEERVARRRRLNHFVKVVEAWPDADPSFEGWMKCSLRGLWDLWPMMQDGDCMRTSYGMIRGVRDVY